MTAQLRTVAGAGLEEAADTPAPHQPIRVLAQHIAMIALGALCLLAAVLANGRPTVFSDTSDYFRVAHSAVRDASEALFKGKPIISHEMWVDHFNNDEAADEEPIHNELGARSLYYGLFIYTLHKLGTIWMVAAAQAALIAGAIYALWRLAAPQAPRWTYLLTMAVLAIGSPLPYIAGFAVPDALTGVGVLAGLMFLLYAERVPLAARLALIALVTFAFNAHASHILTGLVMTACTAAVLLAFKVDARTLLRRSGIIACAAIIAMALNAAYAFAVHLRSGDDLRSPPFMAIRVIADGPGRNYLRATCPKDPKWTLCKFKNLAPQHSNTLMWSDDAKYGIFNVSDYPARNKMEREEIPFVLSVLRYDPLGQLGASLKNWGLQFFSISLNEVLTDPHYYLRDPYWSTTHLKELILAPGSCGPKGKDCKPRFEEAVLRQSEWAVIALAVGFLGWRLSRADVRHTVAKRNFADHRTQVVIVVALLVLATIINAGVCGAISGVFGRYQARIIWLIPMAAMLVGASWGWRSRPRPHLEVVAA